jgi:glycine/D-amino acid oxidase-like deaminating enzyme
LTRVAIVGCGVVGAAVAYELSLNSEFEVLVFDASTPGTASTSAALGILVAIISQKVKGRNWKLREQSWQRYQTLIPELETVTGLTIQQNTEGLLDLCFEEENLPRWESLQKIRRQQGYSLEIWSPEKIADVCPHLRTDNVAAGIFSPQDFQVNPVSLTEALVQAAKANGVKFHFEQPVVDFEATGHSDTQICGKVVTAAEAFDVDYVVLASGLGTTPLTQKLGQPTVIGPVLGQGLELYLDRDLGKPEFQPVVNGDDIHVVPLGEGRYWIGATVEFPPETTIEAVLELKPEAERLDEVLRSAISFCPALACGKIIRQWFGLRPRPQGQAAPVIKPMEGYANVWLATGHYRNGVLLAPATALAIKDLLKNAP